MDTPILITNRREYKTLYSDCVYPDLVSDNRRLVRQVVIDPNYVSQQLRWHYGVDKIANKYAVNIDGMIWYQHDNETWLLQTVNP